MLFINLMTKFFILVLSQLASPQRKTAPILGCTFLVLGLFLSIRCTTVAAVVPNTQNIKNIEETAATVQGGK